MTEGRSSSGLSPDATPPTASTSVVASLANKLTAQQHTHQSGLTTSDETPGYELQWSHLVHAEIISVTSAMRRNSRWSGMSVSGLTMGGLGMNMGLRGRENQKEGIYRNQVPTFATLYSNCTRHFACS